MTQVLTNSLTIRAETAGDAPAISALTLAAFEPMPFSNNTEANVIKAVRTAGELTLSLVAVLDGEIVGQITFTPVTIDGAHDGWFGLGPVSAAPPLQGQGIGGALIREGLAQLSANGASGCALIGNPDYYSRFGFEGGTDLTYGETPSAYVQRVTLNGEARGGALQFSPAFEAAAAG